MPPDFVRSGASKEDRAASSVSGRKRIEELYAIKQRFEHLLACSDLVVYTCEPYDDYVITSISENVLAQLGYEPWEFVNDPKFWLNHVHPEDVTRILSGLCQLFEKDQHTHEYRFLRKNGTYRWILDQMKLSRDETGRPSEIIGYWIDITKQKRMEENLSKTERLAAAGAMTATLAQGLRDPLTSISVAAYELKKKLNSSMDEKSKQMLDLIERDVDRASKMINDLLARSQEPDLT